jgi:Tol biopolymer transport system component
MRIAALLGCGAASVAIIASRTPGCKRHSRPLDVANSRRLNSRSAAVDLPQFGRITMKTASQLVIATVLLTASPAGAAPEAGAVDSLRDAREIHLRNVRQLTFGGENAEAYWSPDGKKLILQSKRGESKCDQIYVLDVEGGATQLVSTGQGKTTCSYFIPGTDRILYASTHAAAAACPPDPDYSQGYVWPIYSSYEIYSSRQDGSDLRRLTNSAGYDAEATCSVDGKRVIFTSTRDGDLDLYTMKPDGSDVRRITREPGYDGGAFFSHNGKSIVWRAARARSEEEAKSDRELLAKDLVKPGRLEIFVADADGSNARQVTSNGAANFCPYFFPDDESILFASNVADPKGRNFDLWRVRVDGTGLEQITFDPSFDGFPMFSPNGKRLAFASNRHARVHGETNIFVADWVEVESKASR